MLRILALACSVPLCAPALAQSTWYVDAGGTPPGLGTQADPYTSIGFALSQPGTISGDTLEVAPGDYLNELVDFAGKDVEVIGTGGSAQTVIEARPTSTQTWPAVRFAAGESANASLEGFTIRGGTGELGVGGSPSGGGAVYCTGASPTLTDLVITGNDAAGFGGGMLFVDSSSVLSGLVVADNGSTDQILFGGGIGCMGSSLTLLGVEIRDNTSKGEGGGIYAEGSVLSLSDCAVQGNFSAGSPGGGLSLSATDANFDQTSVLGNFAAGPAGGGIYATMGSNLVLTSCSASDNTNAFYPGGFLRQDGGELTVTNCLFEGNEGQYGGAISTDAVAQITGSTFVDNLASGFGRFDHRGGALDLSANAVVSHCLFIGNVSVEEFGLGGSAIYGPALVDHCSITGGLVSSSDGAVAGGAQLTNCIVWGNLNDNGTISGLANSSASYSIIEGGAPGAGNLDADPSFWNADAPDLHLLPGSAAIDTGNPMSPSDPDGTRADMGAFPFDASHCGPGCDGPIGLPYCSATTNSTGQAATLSAVGSLDLATNLALFRADGLPQSQFGMLFMGGGQAFAAGLGGGQGNLCVAAPLARFSDQVQVSSTAGIAAIQIDLANLPQGTLFLPGSTWNFQYWFRDANPSTTSNTTGGLEVTWN